MWESNPHAFRHMILSHARLPIPTIPQLTNRVQYSIKILGKQYFLASPVCPVSGLDLVAGYNQLADSASHFTVAIDQAVSFDLVLVEIAVKLSYYFTTGIG